MQRARSLLPNIVDIMMRTARISSVRMTNVVKPPMQEETAPALVPG